MVSESTQGGGRRALLIGIDKYPNFNGADLQGCVNDMSAFAELLRGRFGFPREDVVLLLDERATRDGILAALDELVERVGTGDIVVLGFAGHGSQVTDLEGDEPDGLDETIVPHDSGRGFSADGRPRPNRDITDDELHRVLARLGQKTSYVTVVFDCCHSGTGMRDIENRHRGAPADRRSAEELGRSPLPPLPVAAAGERRGFVPLTGRYVFLAGCSDEERAWELSVPGDDGPVHHGAFSFFFLQELERCRPGDTVRDIFQRMTPKIGAARPGQHPQAEGQLDRRIFGVEDVEPVRSVAVASRAGALMRLEAGLVHGVTVGSRYAIYSPETGVPGPEQGPLCVAEITAVRGVSCDARIVGEADEEKLVPGLRALEIAHVYAVERDAIQILDTPGFEAATRAMRELIGASPLLAAVGPGEPALARVAVRCLRQHRDTPHWTAHGVEGPPIVPAYPLALPGAAAQLCEALEQRARRRRVLLLDNPSPTSLLRGKVSMTLLRQAGDGAWAPAATDERGAAVYRQEERLAIEISNHSSRFLYIYLLDLGLTGGVGQAYPPEGAHEELAAGQTIRWFVRDEEAAQVFLPEGYPFEVGPGERPIAEPTVLKLIASTQPTDLGPMFQKGYKIPKFRADAPLVERALGSLLGAGGRDLRVAHAAAPRDDWTSVAQAYYITEE